MAHPGGTRHPDTVCTGSIVLDCCTGYGISWYISTSSTTPYDSTAGYLHALDMGRAEVPGGSGPGSGCVARAAAAVPGSTIPDISPTVLDVV
eukprot:3711005-Rhodomonas_salina.1